MNEKNKGTRIVVKALTPKGRACLVIQKADEEALRLKYKTMAKWRLPVDVRSYLKTVSAFMPENNPVEHHIMGFKLMSEANKTQMYMGIKSAFFDNGAELKDFEVLFFND